MQSFLYMEGEESPSLQPRPRPYNHAHSMSGRFMYNSPPQSGLPLPLLRVLSRRTRNARLTPPTHPVSNLE